MKNRKEKSRIIDRLFREYKGGMWLIRVSDALFERLTIHDLISLRNVDRDLRSFIYDRRFLEKKFAIADAETQMTACVEMHQFPLFRQMSSDLFNIYKPPGLSEMFIRITAFAAKRGEVEYMEVLREYIKTLEAEEEEDKQPERKDLDDLVNIAVEYNHPSVMDYVLDHYGTDEDHVRDVYLHLGLDAAVKYVNKKAAACFLGNPAISFGGNVLLSLIRLDDIHIFDQFADRVVYFSRRWFLANIESILRESIVIVGNPLITERIIGFLNQGIPNPQLVEQLNAYVDSLMRQKQVLDVVPVFEINQPQLLLDIGWGGTRILIDYGMNGKRLLKYMKSRQHAREMIDACFSYTGSGESNPLIYILRHDIRSPHTKSKSCAYLYALRVLLSRHSRRDDPEMINELLEIPFQMSTLIRCFEIDGIQNTSNTRTALHLRSFLLSKNIVV